MSSINKAAKGGQKGKMKKGTQPVRNRRDFLKPTPNRLNLEPSGQFRPIPTLIFIILADAHARNVPRSDFLVPVAQSVTLLYRRLPVGTV
jgi:hypothetical protein